MKKKVVQKQDGETILPDSLDLLVKISHAQTPVGSILGGVPLSRVITNPDDDDIITLIVVVILLSSS